MTVTDLLPRIPPVKVQDLTTLIDNSRVQTLEKYEISLLETYVQSAEVEQSYGDLVLTNMLRGKKVMHLSNQEEFHYLPGNTMVVPPNLKMMIDFPEASDENPTQCVALAIDRLQIIDTVNYLNEHHPKTEDEKWVFTVNQHYFYNDEEVSALIYKLVRIGFGDFRNKDILADFTVKELLLRIMQVQSLQEKERNVAVLSTSNRFAHILHYIKENIAEKISVDDLSAKVYMSKPTFYRAFKHEFGLSPIDYIIKERIRLAKSYLKNHSLSITEICFKAGFSNLNYFTRMFRQMEGITPTTYRAAQGKPGIGRYKPNNASGLLGGDPGVRGSI
jgi:AraC family transcriptional regulator of arabinose operon